MEDEKSARCRAAAFEWLRKRLPVTTETLSRDDLARGFPYAGSRVRLVGPQGIFKPKEIQYFPLSITTTTKGPYEDTFDPSGEHLLYSYRGQDPEFHENRRLRDAWHQRIPLIYFFSTVPGRYLAVYLVFIVGDDPARLRFKVSADELAVLDRERDDQDDIVRRRYATIRARTRMHQQSFRDRVLRAYEERCTVCNLRHTRLLDAAHITPDSDAEGRPIVSNGLSLCKIHHAAFDNLYFGVRPDYRIVVRPDIMNESDGPMLRHGLQEIDDTRLIVPGQVRDQPDPERLERRFEQFAKKAGL